MSRLKDIVKVNKRFQKSINIRLDYDKLDKVQSYIPARASVQVLKQYLYQISQNKGDKSTILIGPYGKGKSHLLLVLLALVSKKNIGLFEEDMDLSRENIAEAGKESALLRENNVEEEKESALLMENSVAIVK